MNDNLSKHQFVNVPLDHIDRVPIPHESEMGEWGEEHTAEYAQYGGSHGYVQHLARSMKKSGQQEAVSLLHNGDGTYRVDDGNHRLAAMAAAGLTHARARIVEY